MKGKINGYKNEGKKISVLYYLNLLKMAREIKHVKNRMGNFIEK